jgi:enamine deaminase RidA (YjgF/YER057c/UK114 family)
MNAVERQQVGPRLSQACAYGPTVYLAGQGAGDPTADATGQTEQILSKIDQLLEGAGTDKSRLLSATIWLSDMANFADMNKVWEAWVTPGNTPARACVEARLASPHWKAEIAIVAAR